MRESQHNQITELVTDAQSQTLNNASMVHALLIGEFRTNPTNTSRKAIYDFRKIFAETFDASQQHVGRQIPKTAIKLETIEVSSSDI